MDYMPFMETVYALRALGLFTAITLGASVLGFAVVIVRDLRGTR